jgi:hypothetical protein
MGDRQVVEVIGRHQFGVPPGWLRHAVEPAEPLFRRDLPGGCCADEDVVRFVADDLPRLVVGEPPHQHMGVQQ